MTETIVASTTDHDQPTHPVELEPVAVEDTPGRKTRPCGRPGCPGVAVGTHASGRLRKYCTPVCSDLMLMVHLIGTERIRDDSRGIAVGKYESALDREQAALDAAIDAWDEFIARRTEAYALWRSFRSGPGVIRSVGTAPVGYASPVPDPDTA